MRALPATVLLWSLCATASGGFFDNIVNQAKQATDQIIDKTVDSVVNSNEESGQQQPQPARTAEPARARRAPEPRASQSATASTQYRAPAPKYERQLVRDIQTALNAHGYDAGTPDGLYGPGTRGAITAYQRDAGLAVDGVPSYSLLTSLQQAPTPGVADKRPAAVPAKATPSAAVAKQTASAAGQRAPVAEASAVVQTTAQSTPQVPAPLPSVEPGTFTIPGCDVLRGWVGRLKRGEMFQVTPKVEVTSLLRPELTAPLFGLPAARWSHDQYWSVNKKLIACRNAAGKQDRATFNQFHQAAKVVGKAGGAMRRVDRYRKVAAKEVEEILGHKASPALPKIVEAAQMALRGEDAAAFIQPERDKYPRLAYVIDGAKQLAGYSDYLTESDRAQLIERLEAGKAEVVARSGAIEKELAEARAAIAAAPATLAGMRSLQKLNDAPVLAKIGMAEADAFRAEVQQRQKEIRTEMRRQEAVAEAKAKAEASRPIDLEPRLTQLFRGDDLEDMSFGGLTVGMPEKQAVSIMKNRWKYRYEAGGINNDFVATRPIYPQLKKERRNGGKLHLSVMDDDKVGQIRLVERYKAMVVTTQPQAWLQKRLGSPDEVSAAHGGRLLTWEDGDLRLQVIATNQTDVIWRGAGYESELAISIWSEDYEDYLDDLGERCHKLLEEKRGRGSMSEAMWFATHCNLAGGAKDHTGI
jgi:peptidoglycan hydrolase-like protein with peptidoglycan-binding domain